MRIQELKSQLKELTSDFENVTNNDSIAKFSVNFLQFKLLINNIDEELFKNPEGKELKKLKLEALGSVEYVFAHLASYLSQPINWVEKEEKLSRIFDGAITIFKTYYELYKKMVEEKLFECNIDSFFHDTILNFFKWKDQFNFFTIQVAPLPVSMKKLFSDSEIKKNNIEFFELEPEPKSKPFTGIFSLGPLDFMESGKDLKRFKYS